MIKFKDIAQQRIIDLLTTAVGQGSDPTDYVRTFDTRLKDVDISLLPFLVVNVRTMEKLLPGEVGNPYQKYTWTAHIYYMDMIIDADTNVNVSGIPTLNYDVGDQRRSHIMARVEKQLEQNRFLQLPGLSPDALRSTDNDGHTEYVYDSSIQAISFDEAGQDDHYSYTCELYLEIYTDRS